MTSVGATKHFKPEVAAYRSSTGFASGGGFSNYFPRPSYQDAVVPAYITGLKSQFSGLYNQAGRGYPDISAQGQAFISIWKGNIFPLDGTSASCPTAAGVLTLVNDALVAAGKPALGFLNPCLYDRLHTAFTDVTIGSAVGCDSAGFPAKVGWDAVTGFGTPVSLFSYRASTYNNSEQSTSPRSAPRRWELAEAMGPATAAIPPAGRPFDDKTYGWHSLLYLSAHERFVMLMNGIR